MGGNSSRLRCCITAPYCWWLVDNVRRFGDLAGLGWWQRGRGHLGMEVGFSKWRTFSGFEETNRLSPKIGPNSPKKEMKSSSSPIDFSASRLAVAVALFSGGVTFNQSGVEFVSKRIHSHHRKQRVFWPFKMPILMSFPELSLQETCGKKLAVVVRFSSLCHVFNVQVLDRTLFDLDLSHLVGTVRWVIITAAGPLLWRRSFSMVSWQRARKAGNTRQPCAPKRIVPSETVIFSTREKNHKVTWRRQRCSILVDLRRVIFKTVRGKILWRIFEIFPEGEGYVCWIHSHFSTFLPKGTLFELEVELSQVSCLGQQAQPPFFPLLSFRHNDSLHTQFLLESQKERLSMTVMFPASSSFFKTISPGATAVPWDGESHTWRGSFSTSVAGHHVWISHQLM